MTNKTVRARISAVLPFLKPQELRIAEQKRKMQRELQGQGLSRAAAIREVAKHFPKVAIPHEK